MYELNFWFEHGGGCLWSKNDNSKDKFGYKINPRALPLSFETLAEIERLEKWYHGYLDWDYPPNPSPWSDDEKNSFLQQANKLYGRIVLELGKEFLVINKAQDSIL